MTYTGAGRPGGADRPKPPRGAWPPPTGLSRARSGHPGRAALPRVPARRIAGLPRGTAARSRWLDWQWPTSPPSCLAPDTLAIPEGWTPGRLDRARLRCGLRRPARQLRLASGSGAAADDLGLHRKPEARAACGAQRRVQRPPIAEYLELGSEERAVQSLPIYYSYGLSVLNSPPRRGRLGRADAALASCGPSSGATSDEQRAARRSPACRTCTRRCTGCGSSPAVTRRSARSRRPAGALRRELVAHFHGRAAAQSGARLRRHVRPDRGDRAHQLRAARAPAREDRLHRCGDSRRPAPAGAARRGRGPRAGLRGRERDDGLRRDAGRPRAAATCCSGVLRTGDLGTVDADGYFTRRGPPQAVRASCSAAA